MRLVKGEEGCCVGAGGTLLLVLSLLSLKPPPGGMGMASLLV
jgi:hypothetical protein